MDAETVRNLLLSMPGVMEHDHFGRPAYRATNAKGRPTNIFLTLWLVERCAVLMLDPEQQAVLHEQYPSVFVPLANKWGAKGATCMELERTDLRLFHLGVGEALRKAGAH